MQRFFFGLTLRSSRTLRLVKFGEQKTVALPQTVAKTAREAATVRLLLMPSDLETKGGYFPRLIHMQYNIFIINLKILININICKKYSTGKIDVK